jgi:hypothetical protein
VTCTRFAIVYLPPSPSNYFYLHFYLEDLRPAPCRYRRVGVSARAAACTWETKAHGPVVSGFRLKNGSTFFCRRSDCRYLFLNAAQKDSRAGPTEELVSAQ